MTPPFTLFVSLGVKPENLSQQILSFLCNNCAISFQNAPNLIWYVATKSSRVIKVVSKEHFGHYSVDYNRGGLSVF